MTQKDRRLAVSEAAWRVIVRDGLDRASMRAIAKEMDCTIGLVNHHFRNKQELILFALHRVTERLETMMQGAIANVSGTEQLVAMLSSFLPLDQERQEILKVWVAFLGYAVGRETLMAEHQKSAGQLRTVIMEALQTLQAANLIRADIDVAIEANALLALVNGVSLDALIQAESLSAEQQKNVILRYVDKMLCE